MVQTSLAIWHPLLQMDLGCEVYAVFMYFFCCALCRIGPWLMFDVGSCFLLFFMIPTWCDVESSMWCTCCHDFSCCVLRSLCCILMGYSCCHHVCFHWGPFYAISTGFSLSSYMSLCHTDRSILTESSCSGTSLGATPAWGHFPCLIETSPLMYFITIDDT